MSVLENGMDEILTHNERNMCDDLDWSGLASFKFVNNPRVCEGWQDDLNWSFLDRYFTILNYKQEQYSNAKKSSTKDWEKQIETLSSQSSNEIKEYYSRLMNFYVAISDATQGIKGNLQSKPVDDEYVDLLKETTAAPWMISTLPGLDPSSWPYSLQKLLEVLQSLPPLCFWMEPFDLSLDLMKKIKCFILKNFENLSIVQMAFKVLLLLAYLSGSGTKLAFAYTEIWEYSNKYPSSIDFIEDLSKCVEPHTRLIKKIIETESAAHYAKPGSLTERFSAAQNTKYQKNQNCWNTSITTDGEYIYMLVSTNGGGKFKIGTGEAGTLCGKVYLYKAIEKAEESAWAYCRGKLYMKSSFKETGVISIICPNTFKNEGLLQLYCPDLFGNPSKQILNKYYPLLSDGESLFIVGIKLEKIAQKAEESEQKINSEIKEDSHLEEKKTEEKKEIPSVEDQKVEKINEALKNEEQKKEEVIKSEGKVGEIENQQDRIEVKLAELIPEDQKKNENQDDLKVELKNENEIKPEEKIDEIKFDILPIDQQLEQPKIDENAIIVPGEEKKINLEPEKKNHGLQPEDNAKMNSVEVKEVISIEDGKQDLKSINELAQAGKSDDKNLELLKPDEKKLEISNNEEKKVEPAPKKVVEKKQQEKKQPDKKVEKKIEKKEAPKKEEKKKDDPNFCQFILYKFDMSHLYSDPRPQQKCSDLAKELFEGFSCYFSLAECQRALAINNDDIEQAATWLIDNGENERGKKIVTCEQTTLLCEAPITSYSLGKLQKPEISLKSDTILSLELVSRGEWTMNKQHIALHFLNPDGGSATARIFSVNPNDVKPLFLDSHILSNTLNQIGESKVYTNFWSKYERERQPHIVRGSHIFNRDCDKSFSVDSVACYDIKNQKFYVSALNSNFGIQFLVYSDHMSLKNRILTKEYSLGKSHYEQFISEGFSIIQECEVNKFALPWKWLRWTSVYSRAILRYTKLLKSSIEDENSKIIQKTIEKLQARLKKLKIVEEKQLLNSLNINSFSVLKNKNKKDSNVLYLLKDKTKTEELKQSSDRPLISIENSKESIFNLESTEISLNVLLNMITLDEKVSNIAMHLLFLWITHSRPSLSTPVNSKLNDILIKATCSDDTEIKDLAWKVVNIGWESICNSEERERFWFGKIIESSKLVMPLMKRKDSFIYNMRYSPRPLNYYSLFNDSLDPLLMWYLKHIYSNSLSIPERSYNTLIKENLKIMIDKTAENDISSASLISFVPSENASPIAKRSRLTHILESNWDTFENALVSSISDPSSNVTHALFEILIFLCKDSYLDDKNPAEKMSQLLNNLLSKLHSTIGDRSTSLYSKWFNFLRCLVIQCISYSHSGPIILAKNLIQILGKIKKLFSIEGKNLLQYLSSSFAPGADMAQEKVIETSHPYQRGKQQINETISFPGAIAICIEIDPKSQTDNLHDTLWLSSPDNSAGLSNFNGDTFGSSFKLSGKVMINHQLILQGDQIHIEFNAAGQHREESNSSRWGFRIRLKPYYGEPLLILTDPTYNSLLSKISLRLGGDINLFLWISTFNWLSFAISERLHKELTAKPISNSQMLTWPIFEGGLCNLNIEDFLTKSGSSWIYNKMDQQKDDEMTAENLKKTIGKSQLDNFNQIFEGNHNIFKLVKEMRKLQGYSERYNSEKLRPNFKPADKKYWECIEAAILYTMTYHMLENKELENIYEYSNSPGKVDNTYFREQLKIYAKRINEIYNWMLKKVQSIKEKQHALQDIIDMKAKLLAEKKPIEEKKVSKFTIPKQKLNVKRMSLAKTKSKRVEKPQLPIKKPELDENDKKIIIKHFSDYLAGNKELIRDLCDSFKVDYEDGAKCINTLFEVIWSKNNEDIFPNPYQTIGALVQIRLLILLKYNPCLEEPQVNKQVAEEEIQIPILKRANTEENPENQLKILEMRKWVDSYKKWKEWKDPKQDLEERSPLAGFFNFITCSDIPSDLITQSRNQAMLAAKRVSDLQLLSDFVAVVHFSPSFRFSLGILPIPDIYSSISCSGKTLRTYLNEEANKILSFLLSNLTELSNNIKNSKESIKQSSVQIKKESKLLSPAYQYTEMYIIHQLRLIVSLLSDIHKLVKSEMYCESIISKLNYEEILETLIDIDLFCSNSGHKKLATAVSSGVRLIIIALLNSSQVSNSYDFKEKIQQDIMFVITKFLNRENNGQENSIKLEKLLTITFEVVISTGLHKFSEKILLVKHLTDIILVSSNPNVIRITSRILKVLFKDIMPNHLSNAFIRQIFEKIGNYSTMHLNKKTPDKPLNYAVLLHSPTSEEDVEFLFPVLKEWNEMFPTGPQTIKIEEDAAFTEDVFNIEDLYANENLAWAPFEYANLKNLSGFNRFYSGESSRGGQPKRPNKRGKASLKKATPKKVSNVVTSLTKLEKIFDESNKGFEEVKDGDTEEEKERKINEKGFINKIKAIFKEAQSVSSNLIQKGVTQIGKLMSLDQAVVLSLLISQHQTQLIVDTKHKLPVLPVNPFAKIVLEPQTTEVTKSKKPVQVSICEGQVYQKIEYLMETGPSLPALRSSEKLTGVISGNYSRPFLQKNIQTGGSVSLCIQELLELLFTLLDVNQWNSEITSELVKAISSIAVGNPATLGALIAYGGWNDIIRPGSEILVENKGTKVKEVVLHGGQLSGLKSCLVLLEEDNNYTLKTFQLSEISIANPRLIQKITIPHELLASALLQLSGDSGWEQTTKRQLLLTASQIDWNPWLANDPTDAPNFIQMLLQLSQSSPTDNSQDYWKCKLTQVWEKLADRDPPIFITPQEETRTLPSDGFLLSIEENGESSLSGFTLPASSYLTFHPQLSTSSSDFTNHKMLKYWEKYIIPRIQEYVKSSFKPIEMDYFFAQLRQPLRNGDVHKASEVANVLCDYRLPSGLVLPDQRHDWSALVIDEIVIGKSCVVKITESLLQQQESQIIRRMHSQGIHQFPVVIRAIDTRAACLLVELFDHERLDLHMVWLPISCVHPSEMHVPSPNQIADLSALYKDYNLKVSGLYAKEILLQCMSGIKKNLMDMMETMKIACWDELQHDRIEGWRFCRPDYFSTNTGYSSSSLQYYIHHPKETQLSIPRLNWLEDKIIPGKEAVLVEWCVISWHQLRDEMAESARSLDIVEVITALVGPQVPLPSTPENIIAESNHERKYFPLHYQDSKFCGLVLCFKQDSFLCSNSKLQFFADPEGSHLIYEVKAGAQGRGNLSPIVFKTGKVWCTHFSFIDIKCSQYNTNFSGPSILNCRVYGIPEAWNLTAWLTEVLAATLSKLPSSDNISLMHSLEDSICEFLEGSHSPTPIRQILFKLLIRLARRMRYMNSIIPTAMGVKAEWLASLVNEMNVLRDSEFTGTGTLYSSYIQDGVELINTLLLPWDLNACHKNTLEIETPPWIQNNFNTLVFLNYFRHEGSLTPTLQQEAIDILKHDQWETILILTDVQETAKEKIISILSKTKIKMISTRHDIIFLDNKCFIFGDGFSTEYYQETNFAEEVKVEEKEEENKEAEIWNCDRCTFVNSIDSPVCIMCDNLKPVIEIKPKIPQIDIRDIEKKLISKQKSALDELCSALTEELKCSARLAIDSDSSEISKALQERLLTKEGTLCPFFSALFESIWMEIKDILCDDMHKAREKLISLLQDSAYSLFKQLESKGIDLWLQKTLSIAAKPLTRKQLECLTEYVESSICHQTRAALYLPPSNIRFPIDNATSINHSMAFRPADLSGITLEQIKYNWALIRVFNRYIFDSIGLCNLTQHSLLPRNSLTLSLASALSELRSLVVLPVKIEVEQQVFALTSVMRESSPKVTLERLKLTESSNRQMVNFTKAFDQLKDVNPALLRPPKPQGADPFISFEVVFKGELVVGEAGPYRQFFADISKEIQNKNSELLCPTPNNVGESGESIHKYTIRPSGNSLLILQMYEFLGLLMGCCVRTGTRMTLDLPSFFWKPLVGMNLRFEDLVEIDGPAAEMLKFIESAPPELFEESFENFSTKLSDASLVELIVNGKNTPVTYENKSEFVRQVLNVRFEESTKQIRALRAGLAKVVPIGLLNLITWKQLEEWVCGKPYVDIELLKRHTRYSGGLTDTSPRVVWFWEAVKEFSQDELSKLIKFTWGQERLPSNDEEYSRTHTRLMIKPSMNPEHKDGSMPKADTCFFNLELPDYSSKEILITKLRYAVLTDCESMNADNPRSEQQEASMYREDHYSGEEE